jgi:hypothetical protein
MRIYLKICSAKSHCLLIIFIDLGTFLSAVLREAEILLVDRSSAGQCGVNIRRGKA